MLNLDRNKADALHIVGCLWLSDEWFSWRSNVRFYFRALCLNLMAYSSLNGRKEEKWNKQQDNLLYLVLRNKPHGLKLSLMNVSWGKMCSAVYKAAAKTLKAKKPPKLLIAEIVPHSPLVYLLSTFAKPPSPILKWFNCLLPVRAHDKRIACDEEFSDSEDEGQGGRRNAASYKKTKRVKTEEEKDGEEKKGERTDTGDTSPAFW